jgi:general transcription factor 3C polypeptide 5 (transcription factor C subunit 1)
MAEAPVGAPKVARSIPLEHSSFYSVEYPGYVGLQSMPKAVERLGGPNNVTETFKRSLKIDLRLKDNDLFAHPPAGQTVTTHNLLLKVVRRKRKQPLDAAAASSTGADDSESLGQFTADVIGIIPKTIRFRSES